MSEKAKRIDTDVTMQLLRGLKHDVSPEAFTFEKRSNGSPVSARSSPVSLPSSRVKKGLEEDELDRIYDSPIAIETPPRFEGAKRRADYVVKFGILRDAYPSMNIPEPSAEQSIEEIEVVYQEYVKRIHIDSSVEQNKVYLLILWLIIEIVGTTFTKLPMANYTLNQFQYIPKYQTLLIELGERSYSSSLGTGWPIEVRILGMAAFNAIIFVLVQLMANKMGGSADGMADTLRETILSFLTESKGGDVLRRAEEASADKPPAPPSSVGTGAPLGGIGEMMANFAPLLSSFMGASQGKDTPNEKPKKKKATYFGERNRKNTKTNV